MLKQIPSAPDPLDTGVFYDKVPLFDEELCVKDIQSFTESGSVLLHVRRRFANELCLLRVQWRMWLLCFTTDVYGVCMVFRNLAFYRYRAGHCLTQDLGFDLLPEWQGYLTDSPMCVLQVVLIGACAMSFVPRPTCPPTEYAVNMIQ